MSDNGNFEILQKKVDNIIKELGGYWPPLAMLAAALEEFGELAREINALEQIKPKKGHDKGNCLGEELADTLFALLCIANYYKIDISAEFTASLTKYSQRDRDRFSNHSLS